ncbi:hypothetical protein [Metasolibacillus sp.]|uniref:hypothetical protein n=1 Tax=Metasolibacillus sp. TaxID=2703680 RepID=UPI0025E9D5D4|nr:hypothetical protein [Metasolibacillus sp.]MCT6922804.1 hypothetical protein [Metasolibacillus sp.]MCT6938857.1 hypothetical protein [Metasolibacillus sp.]
MRKLFIRFNDEGDHFREIDEDRNYFLVEAEELVEKLRQRLTKEKRVASKPFEFWMDGKCLVISHVDFNQTTSLQKQLEQTMLSFGSWDEELRHQYINKLIELAEEERQLFVNKEFALFAIRNDQIFGVPSFTPFPILLDINQLYLLYQSLQPLVKTGFYTELERMITAIKSTVYKTIDKVGKSDEVQQQIGLAQRQKALQQAFAAWLSVNNHSFVQYTCASFQSVGKERIDALCPNFKLYQNIQQILFTAYVNQYSFAQGYEQNLLLFEALYEKYNAILEQGFALIDDSMVESLVLTPVLQQFRRSIEEALQKAEETENEQESVNLSVD